jgi:hypothetical protein
LERGTTDIGSHNATKFATYYLSLFTTYNATNTSAFDPTYRATFITTVIKSYNATD